MNRLQHFINFSNIATGIFLLFSAFSCSSRSSKSVLTPESENTTITFAVFGALAEYQVLADAFHKQNPTITVQVVDASTSGSASTTSAYDTGLVFGREALISNTGSWLELTPLLEADQSFHPDDFWIGLLTGCQESEKHQYGIPLGIYEVRGIHFNAAAFDAAGLTHPYPGWTWNDLRSAVIGLARRGDQTRYGFADAPWKTGSLLEPVVDASLSASQGQLDAPTLASEIQWYFDLAQTGQLYPTRTVTNWDAENKAWNALLAKQSPALWVGDLLTSSSNSSSNDSIVPFPVDSSGSASYTTPISPLCGVVSAGTQHPQAAWSWLSYLSQQIQPGEFVPARPSMTDASQYWHELSETTQTALRFGLEHGWYGSAYPATLQAVGQALADTLHTNGNAASALATINQVTSSASATPIANNFVVATPEPTQDLSGGRTVIRYLSGQDLQSGDNTFEKLAEEFHRQHPEITVEVTRAGQFSYAGGNNPDPILERTKQFDCFDLNHLGESDNLDVLLDLKPMLDADESVPASDFYPGLLDSFTLDGKLYGLPASYQPLVMYYNIDLLNHSGLKAPVAGWTFDDFLEMASKATTSKDKDPIYGTTAVDVLVEGLYPKWEDLLVDPSTVRFDTSEALTAAQKLLELQQSGVLATQVTDANGSSLISDGRVAFWVSIVGYEGWKEDCISCDLNVGFISLPILKGHKWPRDGDSWGIYISKQSEHPQACWEWLKYLSEQPGIFTGLPARLSAAESNAFEATVGVDKAASYRAILNSEYFTPKGWSDLPAFSNYQSFWHLALKSMFPGINSAQALAAAQQQWESYLQCADAAQLSSLHGEKLYDGINTCWEQAVKPNP